MKKRALGNYCVLNIIFFVLISLFFIIMITLEKEEFLYILLYVLCIVVALQRVFRVIGCYYELNDDFLIMNYITIKKRTKWYDFMAIGRRLSFSYQKEYTKITYRDIVAIDYIKDKKINISMWRKKEVAIKLNNGRYIWIVKNVFSKKQLREIIKCIQHKNSKVDFSDDLINYLNLT